MLERVFLNKDVQRWVNCISFVMNDPFAVLYRSAANGAVVIPEMQKAVEVTEPQERDTLLFWDDEGDYHAAIIY